MRNTDPADGIRQRHAALSPALDERQLRRPGASEAQAFGYGGVSLVARIGGLARSTSHAGLAELEEPPTPGRVRRGGGGRKRHADTPPELLAALDAPVDPAARGDPESPLRWTGKSLRQLEAELRGQGFAVSHRVIAELLREAGYSLLANRKTVEGRQHPDRDAPFGFVAAAVRRATKRKQPVISADAKKEESVGDFENAWADWCPVGRPTEVRVHDFPDAELGKAIPYGVYDLGANAGFVSVGVDHDTGAAATPPARGCGRWNSGSWPTTSG